MKFKFVKSVKAELSAGQKIPVHVSGKMKTFKFWGIRLTEK